jgi:hypothetical protein
MDKEYVDKKVPVFERKSVAFGDTLSEPVAGASLSFFPRLFNLSLNVSVTAGRLKLARQKKDTLRDRTTLKILPTQRAETAAFAYSSLQHKLFGPHLTCRTLSMGFSKDIVANMFTALDPLIYQRKLLASSF